MNGFKRICYVLFSLAGLFGLAASFFSVIGPWTAAMSSLFSITEYALAVEVCAGILAVYLVVMLLRGIFSHKRVRSIDVVSLEGGSVSVTLDAIASQASHIVESDGTCTADRVRVTPRRKGSVDVFVRVLPLQPTDVVKKGQELNESLVTGLAAVCGNKLGDLSIEFVQPRSMDVPLVATDSEATEAGPDPTSEIRVPMGSGHDGTEEA